MNNTILNASDFYMPAEWEKHEGTWLQWPNDTNDPHHQLKLESTWLKMVIALHEHETVHIIVEDKPQYEHVEQQLIYFGVDLKYIDLHIIPTNDVWARDNGPIFVVDGKGNIAITNWMFNGWGNRFDHDMDNEVPAKIGEDLSIPIFSPPMVLEGGAVEVNGKGTFMATRTSIINENRNLGKSQEAIEEIIKQYLRIKHFIWFPGAGKEAESWGDITDSHVDIVARFVDEATVLYNWTDDQSDPRYSLFKESYEVLKEAANESGKSLILAPLPVPENGVHRISPVEAWAPTTYTDASYSNYLVANSVVLVPVFGNANDDRAKKIIAEHFQGREVIGIQCVELTEEGGAVHCVTQQQPAV